MAIFSDAMKLEAYRTKKRLSRFQAAQEIGVDTSTIWRWETGKGEPKPAQIRRIVEWSNGKVTANDFWGRA